MKAVGWIENGAVRWLGQDQPPENTTLFVEVPEPVEDREPIGYELQPIYAPRRGTVVTQAFILCSSCGGAVAPNGGPRYNSLCLKCIDKLDVFNKLIGK
jgi:hypothetical protein